MKYVGCDVSKNKVDLNYINNKGIEVAKKIKNDLSSIEEFYSEIGKDFTVCAENTGVYSELFIHCGYNRKGPFDNQSVLNFQSLNLKY